MGARGGNTTEHQQHMFYEEMTHIIFQLSSNIIKKQPYIFACKICIWKAQGVPQYNNAAYPKNSTGNPSEQNTKNND